MKLRTLSLSDSPVVAIYEIGRCKSWTLDSWIGLWTEVWMDFGVNDDHSAIERPELEASWMDQRLEVCPNHLRCKLSVETELK